MTSQSQPTVLIVDDEVEILRTYTAALEDEYGVITAGSGPEAIELLAETDVDAVLLDRRMPEMTGDEVLTHIRSAEYECRVAMVTAVDPDFDILEMGFDDYVRKPVSPASLRNVVDSLVYWDEYDAVLQEYLTKAAKLATLEAEKPAPELEKHEGYQELSAELDELKGEAEATMADSIEAGEFETLLENTEF